MGLEFEQAHVSVCPRDQTCPPLSMWKDGHGRLFVVIRRIFDNTSSPHAFARLGLIELIHKKEIEITWDQFIDATSKQLMVPVQKISF